MNFKQILNHKPHVVTNLKLKAAKGIFNGRNETISYVHSCRFFHKPTGTMIIFTREKGYHSSGWWKNPDYEQCYHLSLSFKGIQGEEVFNLPRSRKLSEEWVKLFFGDDINLLWVEGPYSRHGKNFDVWHYRLFCDESWQPIKPSGEVYSKLQTPAGWLSYSDLQHKINKEQKLNGA